MVIVSGTLEFSGEAIDAVLAAMATVVISTRQEAGCISYAFYRDLTSPTVFRIFEEWESQTHLDAHLQTSHLAKFREALKTCGLHSRAVKIYDIAGVKPL